MSTRWLMVLACSLILTVVLLPASVNASQETGRRIALLIGISGYKNAPRLTNSIKDARAISESLRRLKFDTVELYDANHRELSTGVREFGIRAATAEVAVIYYAGHGVQVDRENYLIPTDAKLERERDLLYEAIPLDMLLGEVSQASKIGMILLDSCRNNPFIERVARSMTVAGRTVATAPGLARVDNVPRNTIVVMAAKANQIAEDGGEHSPFAAALLTHFQIPGLELSLFFRSVRDVVLRATNNRQEPYVFSSLGADPFYFYPRPPNRSPEISAITPLEVMDAAEATPIGIPQPTDPDQDPLTVRIIGLPRSGEVRIEGHLVTLNALFSAEQLKSATYKPDRKTTGQAGTFDILVEDGRGGRVSASVQIVVKSSHRPPVVSSPRRVRIAQQTLGIPLPTSPDGDPLTVKITDLPHGTVYNGSAVVRDGALLAPQELAGLTFTPNPGFSGSAGKLRYAVDNGRGDVTEGIVEVEVVTEQGLSASGPQMVISTKPESQATQPILSISNLPSPLLSQVPSVPDQFIVSMYERGAAAQRLGDILAARRFYTFAATRNHRGAALALGRLYDPAYLRSLRLTGAIENGNVSLSRQWYQRAADLGDSAAAQFLNDLPATNEPDSSKIRAMDHLK